MKCSYPNIKFLQLDCYLSSASRTWIENLLPSPKRDGLGGQHHHRCDYFLKPIVPTINRSDASLKSRVKSQIYFVTNESLGFHFGYNVTHFSAYLLMFNIKCNKLSWKCYNTLQRNETRCQFNLQIHRITALWKYRCPIMSDTWRSVLQSF